MSRTSRLVVLVTSVAAVVSAMAGTAGAVTWHVSGSGAFHATGVGATFSATNSNLACPGPTATGTYVTGTIASGIYIGIAGTITYSGCSIAGQGFEFSCGYRVTGTTQPAATVVTGTADVTCGMYLVSTKICHIAGSPHAIYTKGASVDTLTLTTSTLNVRGPCFFGPNDVMHLSEQTLTVTSAGGGPHIVRTA